ncbi:holin, BlyA family protein [Vallitalea pronyensis]|uniref:Holin, BlyA family protein n=1 Tax=Vallitalea pronyensis TaxID=1348613 RepID=A0A8J8SF61_9FIRM|nr:Flp1 family type IVb pilin [Vallitalea pronyensis]QUI20924.1 holin, BlyA family protein [Vallitalea pronyensis]
MLKHLKRFWNEEDGLGIVEIALIIIVLIAVAIIFKEQLGNLVEDIFERITDEDLGNLKSTE